MYNYHKDKIVIMYYRKILKKYLFDFKNIKNNYKN